MKIIIRQILLLLALPFAVFGQLQFSPRPSPGHYGVINITPQDQSDETDQNSEPSIGVGTGQQNGKMIVHAFSPDDFLGHRYFTSSDGGQHWTNSGRLNDRDATLSWGPSGKAYAAILTSLTSMEVRQSVDPAAGVTFSGIAGSAYTSSRAPDQPWIKVAVVTNTDHIFVGFNDLGRFPGPTASVRFSLDGGNTWQNTVLERVSPAAGQDSPAVRLAISADGETVYGLFQRWTTVVGGDRNGSVVLVRDDQFGSGGFSALPNNGTLVENNIVLPWATALGFQRLGGGCDVAVNPVDWKDVYVAYTEVLDNLPVLRVERSTDGGANFNLVYSRTNASLPALAVTGDGTVGLLLAARNGNNLEVHFFKAYGGNFTIVTEPIYDPLHRPRSTDRVLASFPNGDPPIRFHPYIGDYFGLTAVGGNFYGTFCASGLPEASHFPSGVYYQRNVNIGGTVTSNFSLYASGTLAGLGGQPIATSIDPYFFYDVALLTIQAELRIKPPKLFPPPEDPRDRLYRFVWPTMPQGYPQFQIESSHDLGPQADWRPVTNHEVFETNGQFVMVLDRVEDQEFFRLKQNVASGQFQVFTSSGRGGILTPTGTNGGFLTIPGAGSAVFTAIPDPGYGVRNWYIEGRLVQSNSNILAVSNITSDLNVLATFSASHDLSVTMGALALEPEQPFLVGSNFIYFVTIQNTGLNPVNDVIMDDILPTNLAFVSATSSQGIVVEGGGVVSADLGTLNPDALATVTISVVPNSEGSMTNTVSVGGSEPEPDLANNSAEALIHVLTPVAITNQPASQIAVAGDTVTFTVGVSGTPPLLYQWARNDVAIIGATNATLTLLNVEVADAGVYTVTVSQNPELELEYEVDSDPANLAVIP